MAVAQDMGTAVGYLPGLSMRRIADLTPGSAKTDAKDAAVIAGAARTMPHTLRAVSASDEDAAALSMLTGFDLDLARAVNQTANRIRGQWLTPDPAPPSRPWWGRGRVHDAAAGAHRRLAHPSRPEARGQDKDWRQAQSPRVQAARHLGHPRSSRPRSTRPWWSLAPTPPRWCCLTWLGSSSRCTLSGPMSPPRSRLLGGWPTLMCQVLTTRARDQGSRPQPSWLAQTLDKDLQAPAPSWPPTPAWHQ